MKLKHLLVFCILLIGFGAHGQTTITEYNYLTKGYKLDLETGRDLKEGYRLELIKQMGAAITYNNKSIIRDVKIYAFANVNLGKIAAVLVETKEKNSGGTTYYCIPSKFSSEDIIQRSISDFFEHNSNDSDQIKTAHYWWVTLNAIADLIMDAAPEELPSAE